MDGFEHGREMKGVLKKLPPRSGSHAPRFALIVGIVYLVIGIADFFPDLVQGKDYPDLAVDAGSRALLVLFPVNVVHHLVHLLIGILGIAAYRAFDTARLNSRGLATVYGALAVMGLISAANLHIMFGLTPQFSRDVLLHAGNAIIAAYFGRGLVDARDQVTGGPARIGNRV